MSLSRVIEQCDGSKTPLARVAPSRAGIVAIPLECFTDYLQSHPLVQAMNCNIRELHNCLSDMIDAEIKRHSTISEQRPHEHLSSKGNDAQSFETLHLSASMCTDCKGYMSLDHRQGCYSCDVCGLCSNVQVVRKSYESEPKVAMRTTTTTPSAAEWAKASIYKPNNKREISLEALQHWNIYVNLSEDDVQMCARRYCETMSVSLESRIAATLLFPEVFQTVKDQGIVEKAMDVHAKVPKLPCKRKQTLPSPQPIKGRRLTRLGRPHFFCRR